MTPDEATQKLLKEIERQYEERRDRWEQSGGNPDMMHGSLSCHLSFDLLKQVFVTRVITTKE